MSELQRQLADHRAKYVSAATLVSASNVAQPSLFSSFKDAAAIDIANVYQAALRGAMTLLQYDQRFDSFINSGILHESSINYQRRLKTNKVKCVFTLK